MVYYHIDTEQAWIQSLGFTNINNRQQVTDPYSTCGAPNAYYSPGSKEITFCRDGLDSSEDADVILLAQFTLRPIAARALAQAPITDRPRGVGVGGVV